DAGQPKRAADELEKASELYGRVGNLGAVLEAEIRLGEMLYGDPARARPHAERAIKLAAELGDTDSLALGCAVLGQIELFAGAYAAAADALERAVALGRSDAAASLAQALVGAGRPDDALKLLDELREQAHGRADTREELRLLATAADAFGALSQP